jgi:hypothetical protein
MLAVATMFAGAVAPLAYAQDAAAGGAQAGDPEAAANEQYKAWKAETDEAKKFELGKALVSANPGTKASEAVAYAYIFDQKTDQTTIQRKYEMSKAYWEAGQKSGKEGAYAEYAIGNLATLDKDPNKVMEYGRTYLQKYPSGKFDKYVKDAMALARYNEFQQMLKDKRYPDAIRVGEEAFAANDNEFIYAYLLTTAGLADEASTGAKSQFVGKVSAWADRGITFIESGKMPNGAKQADWDRDKAKTLATLYKARAIDTHLRIAGSNPTTPEAYQPAIDELKRGLSKNEKDQALYFFLGQAYSGQYTIYSSRYSAMTPEQQGTDEGKAALEKVNSAADMVIDSWVKYIAYAGTGAPEAIKTQLAELWKFRHPDAPDGWQDEIKKANGGVASAAPGK